MKLTDKEIHYRLYYDNTECLFFNTLVEAKRFIKQSALKQYELIKYVYHHRWIPWQDAITIIKKA